MAATTTPSTLIAGYESVEQLRRRLDGLIDEKAGFARKGEKDSEAVVDVEISTYTAALEQAREVAAAVAAAAV